MNSLMLDKYDMVEKLSIIQDVASLLRTDPQERVIRIILIIMRFYLKAKSTSTINRFTEVLNARIKGAFR